MLNQRCIEKKVMRDPIHEYIHIDYQVLWDVLNAREFQRLRRIHQMGTSFLVYHSAEHSRFSHSLGVYEIVRRMVDEVASLSEALDENEKIQVMLAGLLHDLGHGPFSHFFETLTHPTHEALTARILIEDTEVSQILRSYQKDLPELVVQILNHTHPNTLLSSLISGQLDADRMDYLLRDAYFTGTSYGHFDLGRILRTLRVKDDRLMIKESGVHSIEDYIMARYHMYWQVYYHPTSRSVEAILYGFFNRFRDLIQENIEMLERYPMFRLLDQEEPSLVEHYRLDESACYYGFQIASDDPDLILSDFAKRILERKIFEYEDLKSSKQYDLKKVELEKKGFDTRYYLYVDRAVKRPYSPYDDHASLIYVLMPDGEVKELSEVSHIVNAIVYGSPKEENKIFFPL